MDQINVVLALAGRSLSGDNRPHTEVAAQWRSRATRHSARVARADRVIQTSRTIDLGLRVQVAEVNRRALRHDDDLCLFSRDQVRGPGAWKTWKAVTACGMGGC